MSSRKESDVGKMAMDEEPHTKSTHRKRSRSISPSRSTHSRHHRSSRRRSSSRSRSHRHKKRSRSRRRRSRSRSRSKSRSRKEHAKSRREHDDTKHRNEVDINVPLPPDPPKVSSPSKQEDYSEVGTEEYDDVTYGDDGEPIDKERIHREMEEKLRLALAREGKVYPPKKPEASHPVFANDGSFIEIFKKMQEQAASTSLVTPVVPLVAGSVILPAAVLGAATPATAPYVTATATGRSAPPPPMVGRRRGGKILKTGVVAKQRMDGDAANTDPKDFWALYLAEVNKYKNTACETETGNRPLVK